jgi:hypothetical protein
MQRRLFDDSPPPPHSGSETSRAAAESIKISADTLRAKVLDYLKSQPDGATDEQMQLALGMAGNTQRPRRKELLDMGLIRDTGKTRATKSGRQATIWETT